MENQEMFDTVVAHLRQQNAESLNASGHCAYRAPDGKKCAVGCLIPDTEYLPHMEGWNITVYPFLLDLVGHRDDSVKLMSSLQLIHDHFPVKEWESQLATLAEQYGLQFTLKE